MIAVQATHLATVFGEKRDELAEGADGTQFDGKIAAVYGR